MQLHQEIFNGTGKKRGTEKKAKKAEAKKRSLLGMVEDEIMHRAHSLRDFLFDDDDD